MLPPPGVPKKKKRKRKKERKKKELVSSPSPTSSASFRLQTWHWHNGTKCSAINYFPRVKQNKQTNKNGRLLSFQFTFDLDTQQTDPVIFSEFRYEIVLTIITSGKSKPSSVLDKLGLGSKYKEGTAFQNTVKKKYVTVNTIETTTNVNIDFPLKSKDMSPLALLTFVEPSL